MIANITQGNFLDGLIKYNEKKVDEGTAKLLSVENCINDKVQYAKGFMFNLARNSKRKDKFLHVSLNFPVSDKPKLDNTTLKSIAMDYMVQIGFPEEHPVIIYRHDDTEHPHLHIVTSKILSSGRPINDSHLKRRSQSQTRKLEKEYGLAQVESKKQEKNLNLKGRGLNNKIKSEVELVLKRYRPTNMEELNRHLQLAQLRATVLPKSDHHVENSVDSNLVYHRIDEEGKRSDKGIKSSALNYGLKSDEMEKEFSRNRRNNPKRKRIQKTIEGILNIYDKLNIDDFKKKLLAKKIDLHYKLDSKGALVGISYTDQRSKTKYTGEKLGQSFKAKKIARYLTSGPSITNPEKVTETGLEPLKGKLLSIPDNTLFRTLLLLGYKIDFEKGKVYVSDYKNPGGKGYVLLTDLERKLDRNIIKTHIGALKINYTYNSIHKLFIKNRISFAQTNSVSIPSVNPKTESNVINTVPLEVSSGQTGKVQTYNADEHTVSDFDKKKKKNKGKGI